METGPSNGAGGGRGRAPTRITASCARPSRPVFSTPKKEIEHLRSSLDRVHAQRKAAQEEVQTLRNQIIDNAGFVEAERTARRAAEAEAHTLHTQMKLIMPELQALRTAADKAIGFLRIGGASREARLARVPQFVLVLLRRAVRKGAAAAMTMVQAVIDVDITDIEGFLQGESLADHDSEIFNDAADAVVDEVDILDIINQ